MLMMWCTLWCFSAVCILYWESFKHWCSAIAAALLSVFTSLCRERDTGKDDMTRWTSSVERSRKTWQFSETMSKTKTVVFDCLPLIPVRVVQASELYQDISIIFGVGSPAWAQQSRQKGGKPISTLKIIIWRLAEIKWDIALFGQNQSIAILHASHYWHYIVFTFCLLIWTQQLFETWFVLLSLCCNIFNPVCKRNTYSRARCLHCLKYLSELRAA